MQLPLPLALPLLAVLPDIATAFNPFHLRPSSSASVIPPALARTELPPAPPPLRKRDDWGGGVSLGPTKSTVIKAVTTLTPGLAPASQAGELLLWPGLSNGTGDLVQTTLESRADDSWCGASVAAGEWCLRCSLFKATSFGQLDGNASAVSGDVAIKIVYELQADGTTWLQTATDSGAGAVLSSLAYDSGPYMTGYGTGTECDDTCTGTSAAQTYTDTVITLASEDAGFGDTIMTSNGAT